MCSTWYFPRERNSAVTTTRLDAILCIKLKDQRSCQIFGCLILRYNKYPSKKQSTKLILTLMLISGNVELNLRLTNIKYPYRASQLWKEVPIDIREAACLAFFKNRMKTWKCEGCQCKSCKIFIQNVGYI